MNMAKRRLKLNKSIYYNIIIIESNYFLAKKSMDRDSPLG